MRAVGLSMTWALCAASLASALSPCAVCLAPAPELILAVAAIVDADPCAVAANVCR